MHRFNRDECRDLYLQAKESFCGFEPNETIHFNHPNCPAGMDTKKRLYATVTEDKTAVIFYCHHCQGRGMYKLVKYTPPRGNDIRKFTVNDDGVVTDLTGPFKISTADVASLYTHGGKSAPPDSVSGIKPFGNSYMMLCLAEVWDIFKARDFYGLRLRDKLSYVDKEGKTVYPTDPHYQLFLPAFEDGVITGLWIRNHPLSANKVIVYGSAKKMLYDTQEKERFLVVVEDPISAIKLDCLGVPAYSLGGLDMTAGEVIKLRALYDRVIVWLDNDSASDKVIDVIVRTLQLAGHKRVDTVRSAPEPKKCSVRRLEEELTSLGLPVRM